jgi:hypothetical protein
MMLEAGSGRSRLRRKARVIGRVSLASARHEAPVFWMETMILVAGLAIAGLAGIAAAFYFSVRPGNSGNSQGRGERSGRPGAERSPARSGRPAMHPSRSVRIAGRSRPDPDDDFSEPSGRRADSGHIAAGHRVHRGGSPGPRTDRTAPYPARAGARRAASAGSQRADWPDRDADTAAAADQGEAEASRSWRRVAWHKGSEVDEELWPTETFGGVSDEQFWDDLASDKPLSTTARTASPQDPGSRRRLPDVVPVRDGDDRGRGDGNRIANGGTGPEAYPSPATRSGSAERTVIQPVQTGPQPIQGGTQPGTRAYQPGTQPQPYQAAAQSYQQPTQPAPIMGQGGRAGQPDPRGRARLANGTDAGAGAAAAEDPLTSAAYALRPPGAVDGRSYQSSRRPREQYEPPEPRPDGVRSDLARYDGLRSDPLRTDPLRTDPLRSDPLRTDPLRSDPLRTDPLRSDPLRTDPLRSSDAYWSGGRSDTSRGAGTADAYGSTAGLPYPERPYSDAGPLPPPANTQPYGEMYGYGYPVSPVDDPRQPNGARGQGRSGSSGSGSWAARQAYPTGNGHRSPYDPRTNGRG